MSSIITAEELELLSFFEVEPTRLDPDIPWPYNDFAYKVQRGEVSLSFAVAPAYKDIRIILKHGSVTLYELNSVGVEDLKYHNDDGRETLEVVITTEDRLLLRVNPSILISHEASDRNA